MTRPAIPAEAFNHGDHRRYNRGCRCTPCTKAATADRRRSKYLRDTGRGALTSPQRAATHINMLRATGMNDASIQKAANISPDVMYRILRSGRPIRRTTEQRILSVSIPTKPADGRNGARVDITGTRRRMQTLAAEGWPAAELGRRLGKTKQHAIYLQQRHCGDKVRLWVAHEIRALYEQLRDLKPEDNGVSGHHAQRARQRAESKGWPRAAYWDDDDFDNPDFTPATGESLGRNQLVQLRRQEIEHLAGFGIPDHDIAERVGLTERYVRSQLAGSRMPGWRTQKQEAAA